MRFSPTWNVPEPVRSGEFEAAEAIAKLRRTIADLHPSEAGTRALALVTSLERSFDEWSAACHAEARDLRTRLDHSSRLAATDDVTSLANRRSFDERICTAWEEAGKVGAPLGLLLIDIDHFKNLNDTHGHVVGDACLRKVGAAIQSVIDRPSDLACRYGGDEFAVILPDTDEWGTGQLAESIRRSVAACEFTERRTKVTNSVTVSIGAASSPARGGQSPDSLIAAADDALYRAKRLGRDRVELASGGDHTRMTALASGDARVEKVSFKNVDGKIVFGPDGLDFAAEGKRFTGIVLLVQDGKVVQSIGRNVAVIHESARLTEIPAAREAVCIMYRSGRGRVIPLILSREPNQINDR